VTVSVDGFCCCGGLEIFWHSISKWSFSTNCKLCFEHGICVNYCVLSLGKRKMIITIDGPSGAGKSTMAKLISEFFGINNLNTGALYRTVAYTAHQRGLSWDDEDEMEITCLDIVPEYNKFTYILKELHCYYDDHLLTDEIRTDEISDGASKVSALQCVRAALLPVQRELAKEGMIAEGRDSGTVIFPDADIKFYLDGNIVDRAQRRSLQNKTDFSVTCKAIEMRDERDLNRKIAPLKKAEDAIVIDSTNKSAHDVFDEMVDHIKEKFPSLTISPEAIKNTANLIYNLEKDSNKEALQKQLGTSFVI